MSDDASGRKVDQELANRLDTLFDEDGTESVPIRDEDSDPLEDLKSLVMSIEWEITDELMERLVAQVELLKKRYQDDRILVMFLQLLGSLGLYIKSNKGNAHPTAFGLLGSVYASFATAAMPDKISSSEKKKLLYVELNKYKELKEQIGGLHGGTKEPPPRQNRSATDCAGKGRGADAGDSRASHHAADAARPASHLACVTPQQLETAVETIRQLIRDEFQKLRETLVQERSH